MIDTDKERDLSKCWVLCLVIIKKKVLLNDRWAMNKLWAMMAAFHYQDIFIKWHCSFIVRQIDWWNNFFLLFNDVISYLRWRLLREQSASPVGRLQKETNGSRIYRELWSPTKWVEQMIVIVHFFSLIHLHHVWFSTSALSHKDNMIFLAVELSFFFFLSSYLSSGATIFNSVKFMKTILQFFASSLIKIQIFYGLHLTTFTFPVYNILGHKVHASVLCSVSH